MKLKIAEDLSLPVDVVTQTIAVLAKRRAGKSYTMRRLVEQLFSAGQQVALVDPKGDQWGIRSAADGKSAGLPIVILGGERADVPLEAGSGEVVAKLVVEERVSVLLDLSLFRKHEIATFMTGFLENLYRLKAREIYRTPMMLVIDEADAVGPQKPQKGEERMLGAAEDIVRRGGQRGIGCVMVTQRSAVLNKNLLTQAQIMIALRTIAPQDLAAMNAWIDVHGTVEQRQTLMASLPSLPVGDAWVWSPGWPTVDGIFKRVHVLPIDTFDSGATPKAGERRREPKTVADVDIGALKRQMAATIEKAKADDPKTLKQEIAQLRAELGKKGRAVADPDALKAAKQQGIEQGRQEGERDGYARGRADALQPIAELLNGADRHLSDAMQSIRAVAKCAKAAHKAPPRAQRQGSTAPQARPPAAPQASTATKPAPSAREPKGTHEGLSRPQQAILDALAWLESVKVDRADRVRTAMLADQSPRSSGYEKNISTLKTLGLIDYPSSGFVMLTEQGRAAANAPERPPTVEELHDSIRRKVSRPQWNILAFLIEKYPDHFTREEVAAGSNASASSSGFEKNISTLRSLGFINYPSQGRVVAEPVLFLEG